MNTRVHREGRTHPNLWSITKGERLRYLVATLSSTISNVCMLGIPLAGMYALDVLIEGDLAQANQFLLGISEVVGPNNPFTSYLVVSAVVGIVLTALAGIFQFGRNRLSAVASEGIARKLREVLFDRLHRAKALFFDKEEIGDLVQRCTSDVETVRRFMHADIDSLARPLLFLAVMVPVLWWRNPTLTWISLALMPIIVLGGIYFFHRVSALFKQTDEAEGRLTAVLQENLTGIRVVQAFAQEPKEFEKFEEANRDFRYRYIRLNAFESVYWGISDFVCMLQTSIVLIAGGYFVMLGELSIGELMMFTMLTGIVIWRIRQMIDFVEHTGKTLVSLRRVNHILMAEQEPVQPLPEAVEVRGKIVFENVSLTYDSHSLQLDEINLTIEPGETIGIVGRPGSGKSTLIRALLRFYPISSGRILVDGIDIDSVDVTWLRRRIACALQEPFLFSKTIRENLQFGSGTAIDEEFEDATRLAAIHSTINAFSAKFETRIGERGVNLSGGQRQRMALARALVSRSPILVLDDVLSGVDTRTESSILENLSKPHRKVTTIIIAHRLTTIRKVDRIVLMDQGRIAQIGSHEELVAAPGPYRDLCEIQDLLDETIQYETELAAHG
ncbi:MAG: ABC transporter ATP-binding protein [Gammaproteobacteria bacterium]|nr:ABC transporter ATP-binding protein [Gammaproteobacteria bacterium]